MRSQTEKERRVERSRLSLERDRFLAARTAEPHFDGYLKKLLGAGCDREELLTLLCAAAYAYRFDENPNEQALFGMSRSSLRRFARDSRDVATAIEKANGSLLASPVETYARSVFSLEDPPSLDWWRYEPPHRDGRELKDYASQLPAMLRSYSRFVEEEVLSPRGASSSKSFRLSIGVEKFIVADVKRATKKPHYGEVGALLESVEMAALPKRRRKRRRAFDSVGLRKRLDQNRTPPVPGSNLPSFARAFLRLRMKSRRKR